MRDDDRIRSFRDLEAWQLGMELVDLVLPAIKPLQDWDLRRQMAKAVVSIPTNVAEGLETQASSPGVSESRLNRHGIGGRA